MTSSDGTTGSAFDVAPEDVKEFGRTAYRLASELRAAASMLDNEVRGLETSWTGAAASSYQAGWGELHAGAADVWDALFGLADKLGITAENFSQADTTFASAVSSLDLP
ncbi:WXG100 family type VII secretion target [Nocardia sp. CA2R105]|uniref:WXG100 family type VII secretion target n=1 Tax=Nocardia coffeae TaxID=2873381 RepID=UPI001CA70DB2|nr:WXG100 family type VII secretion target [Nocardia coffeae]MBY8856337.1 WXG100 family type VII secretion target [Nocardia coffeae]